jgi:hypothetical protein
MFMIKNIKINLRVQNTLTRLVVLAKLNNISSVFKKILQKTIRVTIPQLKRNQLKIGLHQIHKGIQCLKHQGLGLRMSLLGMILKVLRKLLKTINQLILPPRKKVTRDDILIVQDVNQMDEGLLHMSAVLRNVLVLKVQMRVVDFERFIAFVNASEKGGAHLFLENGLNAGFFYSEGAWYFGDQV